MDYLYTLKNLQDDATVSEVARLVCGALDDGDFDAIALSLEHLEDHHLLQALYELESWGQKTYHDLLSEKLADLAVNHDDSYVSVTAMNTIVKCVQDAETVLRDIRKRTGMKRTKAIDMLLSRL